MRRRGTKKSIYTRGKSSKEENNYREQTRAGGSDTCAGCSPSLGRTVHCTFCLCLPSLSHFSLANPIYSPPEPPRYTLLITCIILSHSPCSLPGRIHTDCVWSHSFQLWQWPQSQLCNYLQRLYLSRHIKRTLKRNYAWFSFLSYATFSS